ncbi:WD40-repeat-containing domain protein [Entophlyctis helioformis]|nr:WD40-repeat-containing domain protein [Entophlyctis helioformis]
MSPTAGGSTVKQQPKQQPKPRQKKGDAQEKHSSQSRIQPAKAKAQPPQPQQQSTKLSKKSESKKRKRGEEAVITSLRQLPQADGDDGASVPAMDDEERELADLVFGGEVEGAVSKVLDGFDLATFERRLPEKHAKDDDDDDGNDDALGFSIDTAGIAQDETDLAIPTETDALASARVISGRAVSSALQDAPAAWTDDGDEQVKVNIRDKKRLRKLRKDFDEKAISGTDYELRLRAQYERMFPTPKWAEIPEEKQTASKRRAVGADSDDGGNEDDDQDDEDNEAVNDQRVITSATDPNAGDLGHSELLRLLRTTQPIVDSHRRRVLSADKLDIVRVKDANQLAYAQAVIQSAQFHPRAPVLLTCGFDKTLRLFQIDGKINPKITSIYIKDMPIFRAHFTPDGRQIIMTGRRKWFYVHDLETGQTNKIWGIRGRDEKSYELSIVSPCNRFIAFMCRNGYISLVSLQTKQWVADLKMNGLVTAVAFSKSGKHLYSFGSDGEVYQWDTATRQCLHRFHDEGCVKATALAVSDDEQYIATGTAAGVVNVYLTKTALKSSNPKPAKTFMNLTTPISELLFHPDSQLLVMASKNVKDALRIVHLPSLRVVQNWPTGATPLGYVSTVAFSSGGGGYLAIGNAKGKVLLYKLTAYNA